MTRFSISDTSWHGYPALRLVDSKAGTEAVVACRGATLLAYRIPGPAGDFDVVEGYPDAAAFGALKGSRSAIMMPFSNRIADGRYRFDGRHYALANRRADGNAMHGLVRDADWTPAERDEINGSLLMRCDALAGGDVAGYPFELVCFARYRIEGGSLELSLSATNKAATAAPLAMGWHPYFRVPSGDRRDCLLQVPAAYAVATDDRLLPLPGNSAYVPVASAGCDYRQPAVLGDARLDTCLTDLQADHDGLIRSRLIDARSDYTLELAQSRGAVHVFTPGEQGSVEDRVAIEPTELMPDAFNRVDCQERLRLPAGATRTLVTRVSAAFRD
jgi:aldose 1-epimerase